MSRPIETWKFGDVVKIKNPDFPTWRFMLITPRPGPSGLTNWKAWPLVYVLGTPDVVNLRIELYDLAEDRPND